jgi:hypothetical protein
MAHFQLEVKDKFKEILGTLTGFTSADVKDRMAELGTIESYPVGVVLLEETQSQHVTMIGWGPEAERTQEIVVVIANEDADIESNLLDLALEMEQAVITAKRGEQFIFGGREAEDISLDSQVVTLSPESLKEGHVTQTYSFRYTQKLTN